MEEIDFTNKFVLIIGKSNGRKVPQTKTAIICKDVLELTQTKKRVESEGRYSVITWF